MADYSVRIEDSFELLNQEEWDMYLGTDIFEKMRIMPETFGILENGLPSFSHPKLAEMLKEHNNKVGALIITYAICKHYFDKGIPDDPWYISPGHDGQSIQYMPLFENAHWMRRYWFSYFSDTFYLKISAIWDSVIEILNHYYSLDYTSDLRLRSNVMKWLKQNIPDVTSLFDNILSDSVYVDAQMYRTSAAHGTSPSSVSDCVKAQKDTWVEVPEKDPNGNFVLDELNRLIMKKVKAKAVISMTVGEYTNVATVIKNMEDYATLSGKKIQELIALMIR
jgi:hypothetical protein